MISPFNTPVETGTRVLVILASTAPTALDINRLVLLDHWLLHSGDHGGPSSLYPNTPIRSGQFGLKRRDLAMGIEVMLRAGLVEVVAQSGGIFYRANDVGLSFLGILEAPYVQMLKDRATWTATQLDAVSRDSDMRSSLAASLSHWSAEFLGMDGNLPPLPPPNPISGSGG
jgi:hypothetical protein